MAVEKYFSLKGKVALVTGGSRGLGKSMARGYAEAGASVLIASRGKDELEAAASEIRRGLDAEVDVEVADLSIRSDASKLADAALKRFGKVDILVNNAGMNMPQAIDEITDEVWDRVLEVNLSSCMALSRALVPQMKQRKWGRIIYISSIMGYASKERRDAYSATKSALLGLCRANALELGPHGITVNCLSPGPFLTDMPGKMLSESEKQNFADRTALLRWAHPDELIGPALLLASDAGSYVTGTSLVIDGGTLCKIF